MSDYQLTLNKDQAKLVQQALHIYARLHMGQFAIVMEEFSLSHQQREDIENFIKPLTHPNDPPNCYPGVASQNKSANAWDIMQVIRHQVAWDELKEEGKDRPDFPFVKYDFPMKTGEHKMPKMNILED